MKYFSKFGLKSIGVVVIACLILVNVAWISWVYSSFWYFFNKIFIGFTIVSYSRTNIHTNFIFPKKYYTPLFDVEGIRSLITLILSGSIYIPSLLTMHPKSFPYNITNRHFFGFKYISYNLQHSNTSLKCLIHSSLNLEWIVKSSW